MYLLDIDENGHLHDAGLDYRLTIHVSLNNKISKNILNINHMNKLIIKHIETLNDINKCQENLYVKMPSLMKYGIFLC